MSAPGYEITAADRRPLPASYASELRRPGLSDAERARPFARYMSAEVGPVPDHVRDALDAGRRPAELGYEVDDVVRRLSAPGPDPMETGWTRTGRGTLLVACRTDMPGVTAQMWDWWFGWHSRESARYKLWHPEAHMYAALGEDRGADRSLTDRQRYVHNVSYVDEIVGGVFQRLAIRFLDPARLGFTDRPGTTHVCARVGPSDVPVAGGWLVHQVRPTDAGCEMRSRFFLGHSRILGLPAHSVSRPLAGRVLTSGVGRTVLTPVVERLGRRTTTGRTGHGLLRHCAEEMNHLAGFLPALYDEFRGTP